MRVLLAILAVLTLGLNPTQAFYLTQEEWKRATPPIRFWGTGEVSLKIVQDWEVEAACGMIVPAGSRIIACYKRDIWGRRTIIAPNPCPYASFEYIALVYCHEAAHAFRGWKHEQP